MTEIMEVKSLTAGYSSNKTIIKNLSFDLKAGETLGLSGSSGSGKTTVIWAILGMLMRLGGFAEGEVLYNGTNLLELSEREWQRLRWEKISLVPQSSMNTFNPAFTIGRTFKETVKAHKRLGWGWMKDLQAEILMDSVGLSRDVLNRYPHELSGGMRQRVAIALALLLDPEILILDEATTGLDVVIEADILKLMRELQNQRNLGILFVSHDKRVCAEFCDRSIYL